MSHLLGYENRMFAWGTILVASVVVFVYGLP